MSTDARPVEDVRPPARRRNTVLAALETFRSLDPGVTINNMLVLLYVAENQGLNVTELAAICGLNTPTASRTVRALASPGERGALPPYLGLIKLCRDGPAKNSRTLRLTPAGEAVCARLERLIADASPIVPPAVRRRGAHRPSWPDPTAMEF